jgi:hypothetical protein
VGVTADRGPQSGNPLCQIQARSVVRGIVTDVHHGLHAGLAGLLERLFRCQWLAQVQEVGVGIDQAAGSGFSIRGKRTPPSAVWVRGGSLPHSLAVAHGALRSTFTWAATLLAVSGRNGEIK